MFMSLETYLFTIVPLTYVLLCIALILIFIKLTMSDCDLQLQLAESRYGRSKSELKNKVMWITGASSGIGEYLAYEAARVGAKLILSARREENLERIRKKCIELGCKADNVLVLRLDMRAYDTHAIAVDRVIEHFGKIDILVNNAGRSQRADWVKVDIRVDEELFAVNVFGTINLTRCVLPHMLERQSGQIAVTSSLAGKLGAPFSGTYSGTKFALQGYFSSLNSEVLPGSGVSLSMVCPGPVYSEIRKNSITDNIHTPFNQEMTTTESLMTTERCAHLMAVAIANKQHECWITQQPFLFFTYAACYAPSLFNIVVKMMGKKRIKQMRDRTLNKDKKN